MKYTPWIVLIMAMLVFGLFWVGAYFYNEHVREDGAKIEARMVELEKRVENNEWYIGQLEKELVLMRRDREDIEIGLAEQSKIIEQLRKEMASITSIVCNYCWRCGY